MSNVQNKRRRIAMKNATNNKIKDEVKASPSQIHSSWITPLKDNSIKKINKANNYLRVKTQEITESIYHFMYPPETDVIVGVFGSNNKARSVKTPPLLQGQPEQQSVAKNAALSLQSVQNALPSFLSTHFRSKDSSDQANPEPQKYGISKDSTFKQLCIYIEGIGAANLSYLQKVALRLPALKKDAIETLKKVGTQGLGTVVVLRAGEQFNIPTQNLVGGALVESASKFFLKTADVFMGDDRPIAQEFKDVWENLKATLAERLKDCPEETKKTAQRLRDQIDYHATWYLHPERVKSITVAHHGSAS